MVKQFKIYALVDPNTEEVRYVGVTKHKLQTRLNGHLRLSEHGGRWHVNRWIRKMNTIPVIQLLELVSKKRSWKAAERKWIKLYRDQGVRLTNMTDGGEGIFGYKFSEDSVSRMRQRLTGRSLSEEHKKKIGKSNSISMLGKHPTPETLLKKSVSAKQYFETHNGPMLGMTHTVEARQKISKSHKGVPWTQARHDACKEKPQC